MPSSDSNKDFDVIVFGASGYAGAFVAQQMLALCEKNNIKLGLAGRNSERIIQVIITNTRRFRYHIFGV